tara:strand:+ start:718 stop:966 length:249 start_codon:yes stop_codon:yes gene_type:complete
MLNTSLGFSFVSSTIITALIYFVTREKNKTEQEQKDKLQHMIMIYVISFIVILFGKLCLSDKRIDQVSVMKSPEMKGGQCPF